MLRAHAVYCGLRSARRRDVTAKMRWIECSGHRRDFSACWLAGEKTNSCSVSAREEGYLPLIVRG